MQAHGEVPASGPVRGSWRLDRVPTRWASRRCTCLARMTSGSRGSSSCTPAAWRRPVVALRRCLMICDCRIPYRPVPGRCRSSLSSIGPERPDVSTASTRPRSWQAAILEYRPALPGAGPAAVGTGPVPAQGALFRSRRLRACFRTLAGSCCSPYSADKQLPAPDHAPFEFGLPPGDANEHVITSGGIHQRRYKGGGACSPATRPVRWWASTWLAGCSSGARRLRRERGRADLASRR